jgi:hypothetical protein
MHTFCRMNRYFGIVASAVLLMSAVKARAQEIRVELPTIRFEQPPPLVVAEPGIQVVPDQPEEVFYVDGWYWTRRGDHWFRTHDYRGQWVGADRRIVPDRLYRVPPGHYRHWHAARREERREERHEERREERHEERR